MHSSKRSILVIDDDSDIRDALHDALSDEGYETIEAAGGREGLDYLRSHWMPSLILLDLNMAPMSGPEFLAEVARDASLSRIPVILLTADPRTQEMLRGTTCAAYQEKPVVLEKLLETISQCCESHSPCLRG